MRCAVATRLLRICCIAQLITDEQFTLINADSDGPLAGECVLERIAYQIIYRDGKRLRMAADGGVGVLVDVNQRTKRISVIDYRETLPIFCLRLFPQARAAARF